MISSSPSRALSPRLLAASLALIFSAPLALANPGQGGAQNNGAQKKDAPAQTSFRYMGGRVLIVAKPGVTEQELDRRLAKKASRRLRAIGKRGAHVILAREGDEMALINELKADPAILFAELDRVVEPDLVLNDPQIPSQYALNTVFAPAAWDTTQGAGQTIAILDTGVDSSHPDLALRMVPGFNFYDNNDNTADVRGHGTAVAGTAAGIGNNGLGVAGVCPQCKIMPIRIAALDGYATYSTMSSGLHFAADNGAKIANLSYSGVHSYTVADAASYLRSKGGNLVMSAGNSGVLQDFPSHESFLAISATTSSNALASFSSTGAYVDLAAPGSGVMTTLQGGGYGYKSGTSFSAPIVAGVFALVRAANPALSPTQIDNIIIASATDLGDPGKDVKFGHGLVNAQKAVAAARSFSSSDTTSPTVSFASPTPGSRLAGLASFRANASDNIAVTKVELLRNGTLIGTSTASPWNLAWNTLDQPDGAVSLTLRAFDAAGNASSSTASFTVANDTIAPVVSINSPFNGATVSGTTPVSVSATDDKKVASISLVIDGKQVALAYGSSISYSWAVPTVKQRGRKKTATSASSTITATATDPAGNQSSKSITVKR